MTRRIRIRWGALQVALLCLILSCFSALAGDIEKLCKSLVVADAVEAHAVDQQLQQIVLPATGEAARSCESCLLHVVEDPQASVDGRLIACRYLRIVGTAESVPALAKLLVDHRLAHAARYALAGISSDEIDDELLAAFSRTRKSAAQIGIINTLGVRKSVRAVPTLMSASLSSNNQIATAAFGALARMDAGDVRSFLKKQMRHGRRRTPAAEAWLSSAWLKLNRGAGGDLAKDYKWLVNSRLPLHVRVAAMNGFVRSDAKEAADTMFALLQDSKPEIRIAAARALRSVPEVTAQILSSRLKELSPDVLCVVLPILGEGTGAATVTTIKKAMVHENERVRIQAVEAMGRLESADAVQSLLPALGAPGKLGKAAYGSLCRLGGPDVGIALRSAAGSASPSVRGRLIDILRERGDKRALPLILAAVRDPNPGLSKAACRALAALAEDKHLKTMIDMLLNARRSCIREELAKAIGAVVARCKDKNQCAQLILAGLRQSRARSGAPLIPVLGEVGSKEALSAVRKYLTGNDNTCRKLAVKTLVDWPDESPKNDLLNVARNERDLTSQVLALRGYIRMIERSRRSAAEKLKTIRSVVNLARRDSERKAIEDIIAKYAKEAGRK